MTFNEGITLLRHQAGAVYNNSDKEIGMATEMHVNDV